MFNLLHLGALIIIAPFILYADHLGFQYFRGKKQLLMSAPLKLLHNVINIGLLIIISSGIGLVLPAWDYYITDAIFQLKMFFVLTLIINGWFISRLMKTATTLPYANLKGNKKAWLLLSGITSIASWFASAIIGLYLL